jgi:hypothetical protein
MTSRKKPDWTFWVAVVLIPFILFAGEVHAHGLTQRAVILGISLTCAAAVLRAFVTLLLRIISK